MSLELDTPVYVMSHKQYGVVRKVIRTASAVGEADTITTTEH